MIVDVITAEVNHPGFSVSRRILNSQGSQYLINAALTGEVKSFQNHLVEWPGAIAGAQPSKNRT